MEEPRETVSIGELRQYAELLERACITDGKLTHGDADARRPGVPQYPNTPMAWAEYIFWLGKRSGGGAAAAAAAAPVDGARGLTAADAMRQMVHAEPIRVKLDLDRAAAKPVHPDGLAVHVYPKAESTLCWLDSLDAQLRRYECAARQAAALESMSDDRVLATMPLVLDLAVRLWAWILITPGPGMPFDPDGGDAPTPPDFLRLLSTADLVALHTAHADIHLVRPRVLMQAHAGDDKEPTRLSLDGMLAAFAKEQKDGPPRDVLSRWSLGEILATSVAESVLHRESRVRAEQSAKEGRRR